MPSDVSAIDDWKLTVDNYTEIFTGDPNAGVVWTRYVPTLVKDSPPHIGRYKDIPPGECLIEIDSKVENNRGVVREKTVRLIPDDSGEGAGSIEVSLECDDLPGDRTWWYSWRAFIRRGQGQSLATLGPKVRSDLMDAINEAILEASKYLEVTPKEFIECIRERVALESLARLGKSSR